jgi:4-hydroxy-3-methylbut-2-enyl diphosphate reductase
MISQSPDNERHIDHMRIVLAKSAGFCFGVKRAVDTVYSYLKDGTNIYTFGPIIHNEEVVKDLEERGVCVVKNIADLADKPKGIVILRAHGIEKDTYEALENMGFEIIDATCPFVLKIHRLVEKYSREGWSIVIVGDEKHPEVKGIKSWSQDPDTAVISTVQGALDFCERTDSDKKVCVVSQTTFNYKKFKELVEIINKKGYDSIDVLNTICNATEERQAEAAEIAAEVDAMIVVGGRTSSNTQKLFEICRKECINTYYIQTVNDLVEQGYTFVDNVGITAGASTPNNIIEEVQKYVRNEL